jgi:hypothetical protein
MLYPIFQIHSIPKRMSKVSAVDLHQNCRRFYIYFYVNVYFLCYIWCSVYLFQLNNSSSEEGILGTFIKELPSFTHIEDTTAFPLFIGYILVIISFNVIKKSYRMPSVVHYNVCKFYENHFLIRFNIKC